MDVGKIRRTDTVTMNQRSIHGDRRNMGGDRDEVISCDSQS
jgi:hypothetical protein